MTDEVFEPLAAADLFGGRDMLASKILESMEKRDPSRRAFRRDSSISTLAAVSREELLESLEAVGVSLNEVMSCEWDERSRIYWEERLQMSGSGTGIASGGAAAPAALLLNTYVRLEALGEVCGKAPPRNQLVSKEKLEFLRKKYREMNIS